MADEKIYIKLFGGEQDGWDGDIPLIEGKYPDMFYIHRVCDAQLLSDAEKTNSGHFEMLTDALSILAYEFVQADPKDGVTGGRQFRYDRCAKADKALSDPAI